MSTKHLFRWAGLAALSAGCAFVVVELLRPPVVMASVTTPQWIGVHELALAMAVLGLAGVTGVYTRQAAAAGKLGVVGYGMVSLWLVLTLPFNFIAALVLPLLAREAPGVAAGFVDLFARSANAPHYGTLSNLWNAAGILFIFGSLIFGIATLRARVLPRWAAGLFTLGIGLAPAYSLLPAALQPFVAVPIGLGLAGLGWALLTERRAPAAAPALSPATVLPAGAE